MAQRTDQVSVTLAAIARLAGVGRAAVSNWKRRYPDFPLPVGGTDASPQFALDAVEAWLKRNDKIAATVGPLERLWPRVEDLGDRDRMGRVVAGLGARLSDPAAAQRGRGEPLDPAEQALVDDAARMAGTEGEAETFRFLLDRWLGTHVRQIATTPPPLATLMTRIAAGVRGDLPVRTVADPACGTGTLLLTAARRWSGADTGGRAPRILGNDVDPVLAMVADARLALETDRADIEVTAHDTLRNATGQLSEPVDVVLSNPPANARDWGHEELATDQRWAYGQPPRTESELAWVQHIVSMLGEGGGAPGENGVPGGGVAVVLLPPGVAARRAGRRIRAGLLRAGVIRAVVALPAGAAPPYGVGLHLWVLAPPAPRPQNAVLLVDTSDCRHTPPTSVSASRLPAVDWDGVQDRVLLALEGVEVPGGVAVPVTDLLGEETDLTPARHVAAAQPVRPVDLRRLWARYDKGLLTVRDAGGVLRDLSVARDSTGHGTVSIAELEQAKALAISSGTAVPEEKVRRGEVPEAGVELLTGLAASSPAERQWLDRADAEQADRDGLSPLTSFGDVVVVATAHGFDAWVETAAPRALGHRLHRLRVDPARLDPWFLAACLRERSNARRAGGHSSSTSRVDVRRLHVLRLPLDEQQTYGEVHRKLVDLESALAELAAVGGELSEGLTALLAAGRLEQR
ncbi:N-6 DNA methylase [Streptomyces sp. NBC_01500]|uniref:N-6 DNA methylase n=1 Tax=Streptomyces sp. NBC_01500 TaxID=2903886 RepID=UPI00224E3287|nr:N-6 DNA methylase [Streptomyces sp. NBC_01500]MCX4547500.1 N-6 DNA methylase [Streptomyces sp. NBC_01500]